MNECTQVSYIKNFFSLTPQSTSLFVFLFNQRVFLSASQKKKKKSFSYCFYFRSPNRSYQTASWLQYLLGKLICLIIVFYYIQFFVFNFFCLLFFFSSIPMFLQQFVFLHFYRFLVVKSSSSCVAVFPLIRFRDFFLDVLCLG